MRYGVRILTILLLINSGLALSTCSDGSGPQCSADEECPIGRYCQAGKCGYDCTFDANCPTGFRCTERGSCERGCVPSKGGVEACDNLDNDCDDLVDEDFPALGSACQNGGCPPGLMICTPDGLDTECDGQQPTADDATCDGLDQDCDGQTDEDAQDKPCPLATGVCTVTAERCEEGQWTACDYGPAYTPELDATCDGLDEDCDGQTDEDALILPVGEYGDQANDGIDNNCSGIIDEPAGVMVPALDNPGVAIDAYEVVVSDSPDCNGIRYGISSDDFPAGFPAEGAATTTLYACSLAGVLPSGHMSWHRARWACEAQGKRLCTIDEFHHTCAAVPPTPFPYGFNFTNGACNCGFDNPENSAETGSYSDCRSGDAWDMSGNLSEWVSNSVPDRPTAAVVVGFGYVCETCPYDQPCEPCDLDHPDHFHRVEMAADCLGDGTRWYEGFYRNEVKPYLGTRCCWDM